MTRKPEISIVIPAYNEAKNFERGVLTPTLKFLDKLGVTFEVIFVDDGSTDATNKLLAAFCRVNNKTNKTYELLSLPHAGKAVAVKTGVLRAEGKIILFCDFDQATPITFLSEFLLAHKTGADVVIGDRSAMGQGADYTFLQRVRSQAVPLITRILLGINVNDTQCGFKSLKATPAKKIFNSFHVSAQNGTVSGGYMGAFDVELIFLAGKFGYKLAQIPVPRDDPYGGQGKYGNKLREMVHMLRDICKVRLFDLIGRYKS